MKKFSRAVASAAVAAGLVLGGALTAAPASAAGACVDYNYSYGGRATCVAHMQKLVNQYVPSSYDLVADGVFGPKTRTSVKYLQSQWRLTVDGIVGPKTWGLICRIQAGWVDANGNNHMAVPSSGWLSTAKAAGCQKYWKGMYVGGVKY